MSSINQQCITNNHRYIVHQNLRGNSNDKKPHKFLLYIKDYIHRKHQLPNSLAPTGRRLQPLIYRLQPKGRYKSPIYQLQLEGGSNLKESPTP